MLATTWSSSDGTVAPEQMLLALLLSGKITRRDCALAQPVPV
jgi:hypothetical protein